MDISGEPSERASFMSRCPTDERDLGDPESERIGFLLVGAGPHARRTYIPHLQEMELQKEVYLRAIVDIEETRSSLTTYLRSSDSATELIFVTPFSSEIPGHVTHRLNEAVARLGRSVVVISTEPRGHKVYGMWALKQGLHVIMDKPITTRRDCCSSLDSAHGIAQNYVDLLNEYKHLQKRSQTCFLVNSHRRYHPDIRLALRKIEDVKVCAGYPVTNIISTHCDGMWRMPTEIVHQSYHTFNQGYEKVSHSGYHFLDTTYCFLKSGWSKGKEPERLEVVSSFLLPNGFLTALNGHDYGRLFGEKTYNYVCSSSDDELRQIMPDMDEMDTSIQITAFRNGDAIALAQVNLQHIGFSRRSWLVVGYDLYKGIRRVRHETHEVKSGPLQTVVIESRQANDKHERSEASTVDRGSDNNYDIHVFRNSDLFEPGEIPLRSYNVDDLYQEDNIEQRGLYGENIKRGILNEAIGFVRGIVQLDDLTSNLSDHSVSAHLMSAAYMSHVSRSRGQNPIVGIDMTYHGMLEGSLLKCVEFVTTPRRMS